MLARWQTSMEAEDIVRGWSMPLSPNAQRRARPQRSSRASAAALRAAGWGDPCLDPEWQHRHL